MGGTVVEYKYDAWGNILAVTGSMANTLGAVNPFRYRGYYFDTESGFYYLQSRYYDPQVGRFLNADSYVSTGHKLRGYNMFAYCGNNPVMYVDESGMKFTPIIFGPDLPPHPGKIAVGGGYGIESGKDGRIKVHKIAFDQLITKQSSYTDYMLGQYPLSYNGCEVIAIYNAQILLGYEADLHKTIDTCENSIDLYFDGFFGILPFQIPTIINELEIGCIPIKTTEKMDFPGVYIVSYWNSNNIFDGLHTVAVYYDGNEYTTYNKSGGTYPGHPSEYVGDRCSSVYYLYHIPKG